MHVFHVPSQVAALSEGLVAELALERSGSSVLSKVVPQVARLPKDLPTVLVKAFEVELDSTRFPVSHLDGLVQVGWNAFKSSVLTRASEDDLVSFQHVLFLDDLQL